MVESLGDIGHSAFLTPDMIREQRKISEGRYKGVGIELRMENGHALIVAPLDGSPAQKAGLHSGEFITGVDGKRLIGLDLIQIIKLISGPSGSRVRLTIFDPAANSSKDVILTRASIIIDNVRWKHLPGTGIAQLRIAGFSKGVTDDLRKDLDEIRLQGIRGIILDLRDDPGGLLVEAVGCTSQFLGGGNVLLEKNAAGKIRPVPVMHGGEATRIPLVVLVNGGTASAAEIMAGAIQDAGRAKLVGNKTFGTGTVLDQFNLSDGSALMLAVEEWLTPKGHSIWHKGITPDFDVNLSDGVRPLLPDEEKDLKQSKLQATRDTQLLTAIRLLSGEKK
jgi:carboxyl-terminal processing protease